MPRSRWKVCSRPGCPELTQAGRCDGCAREADRSRGTAAERGYDARWRRTRAAFLHQHVGICEHPGCLALVTDVDHIDGEGPLGPRGHDFSNLRGLCKPHHSQKTIRENGGFGW